MEPAQEVPRRAEELAHCGLVGQGREVVQGAAAADELPQVVVGEAEEGERRAATRARRSAELSTARGVSDRRPFNPPFFSGPGRFGPSLSIRHGTLLSVDADRPLKALFRLRPRDLLALIGDAGAALVSTQVAELPSLSRRVDTVLRLRRGRQRYVRHLEFQIKYRKGLEFRCFEYAALLVMRFRVPVLTTVVLVKRSGPRELAYREVLGGRVVHERRFDVVRLWEMDPGRALRFGPGGAALVGTAEKTTLPLLARAARKIQRETEGVVRSDLLFILQALSRRRYTAGELGGVIPKETVMAGSLWAEAAREGRMEGRVEGRIEGARELCLDLAKQHHPGVADRAARLIEACSDVERLHEWALQAHQLSDSAFLKLLTEPYRPTSGPRARRAPRPSRKRRAKRSA